MSRTALPERPGVPRRAPRVVDSNQPFVASPLESSNEPLTRCESWEVGPAVRRICSFRRHNLLEPLDAPPQDCIFVRNVMIYFDRESKAVAVRNLVAALAPGGHLVVGPADGIYELLGDLERRSTFLYRKP